MLEKYLNNNNICFTLEDAEKLIKERYDNKRVNLLFYLITKLLDDDDDVVVLIEQYISCELYDEYKHVTFSVSSYDNDEDYNDNDDSIN
jgi:hypothetical protein